MKLSSAVLGSLPFGLQRPQYNRTQLLAGILHIGVGNFHRSHMAAYLDDLLDVAPEENKNWAICGASVTHFDKKKRDELESHDYLSTLVERDATTCKGRILGSMIDYVLVDTDHKRLRAKLADPKIQVVRMTFTEGGYF